MKHLKFTLIWLLCVAAAVASLAWLAAGIVRPDSRRVWRIAVGFDQTANATAGGDEDLTISARCWENRCRVKYRVLMRIINAGFDDPDHCRRAYEQELARCRTTRH